MNLGVSIKKLCILYFYFQLVVAQPKARKKNHNQEIKVRAELFEGAVDDSNDAFLNLDNFIVTSKNDPIISAEPVVPDAKSTGNVCEYCSVSGVQSQLKLAVDSFWANDMATALACSCQHLLKKKGDGMALALQHSLQSKLGLSKKKDILITTEAPPLKTWEVLGPINVGKLEVDADPSFHQGSGNLDVGQFILSLPSNSTVNSELMPEGTVGWRSVQAKKTGEVELHFSVSWNELAQGLSSSAVYEFQGWARTTTYASVAGSHILSCQGVHTVYVRNDHFTHILTGDVYRSNQVWSSVDLRVGLVGIVVPLRGAGQSSFSCQLVPSPNNIVVHPVRHVSDLLELEDRPGQVLMLSGVFALPVLNAQSHGVTLEYAVEKPLGVQGEFFVRPAPHTAGKTTSGSYSGRGMSGSESLSFVAPGQTIVLALEIVPAVSPSKDDSGTFLSCAASRVFTLFVTPSRGQQVRTSLEFPCRRQNQSVSLSYVDHDGSVVQAAVILPVVEKKKKKVAKDARFSADHAHNTCDARGEDGQCEAHSEAAHPEYPVLLTLHGSGISAASHADAHKTMPKGKKDYLFGVVGFWVLAPSRFGAHNWEAVGELTARHSVSAISRLFRIHSGLDLPQMRADSGMVSGHSMGGHGAWMVAMNSPDRFSCLAPQAGWIQKEEYGTANAFFALDISSSFVDAELKAVFGRAMGEFHADKLVPNVRGMDVHIRVGSSDLTTHPWYSRRMHRLLEHQGVNSTLEEVRGKQHWWWDTLKDNDGGVVNDPRMRELYAHCAARSSAENRLLRRYVSFLNSSAVRDNHAASTRAQLHRHWQQSEALASPTVSTRKCHGNVSLVLFSPGMHSGRCGVRVLQQVRSLSRSAVEVVCSNATAPRLSSGKVEFVRRCVVITHNVRKLRLNFGFDSVVFGADLLTLSGAEIRIQNICIDPNSTALYYDAFGDCPSGIAMFDRVQGFEYVASDHYLDFCMSAAGQFHICDSRASHTLSEKRLVNSGPVRLLYARPFTVVYGTPQNQALRLAMKDLAVYIGNAHYAAHGTHVRVLSDLEYRTGSYAKETDLTNIMFVGGPPSNKLLKALCVNMTAAAGSSATSSQQPVTTARLPGEMSFSGGERDADLRFTLDGQQYGAPDQGVIFTMPLHRSLGASINGGQLSGEGMAAMGVVVHANSAQGYLHLSKLAWPVVPPMVRAPFANYLPDFTVVDGRVWSLGLGAVLAAGYWDYQWGVDRSQSYQDTFSLQSRT